MSNKAWGQSQLSCLGVQHVDHLALSTDDLTQTLADYLAWPGVRLSREPADNAALRIRHAFVQINPGLNIEVLAPLPGSDNPAVAESLTHGNGAYHFCCTVADLDAALQAAPTLGVTHIEGPAPDPAFDGRRVALLLHPSHGLLELLETGPMTESPPASPSASNNAPPPAGAATSRLDGVLLSLLPKLSSDQLANAAMNSTPGWDSLMQLRLMMALEREFKRSIPTAKFEQLKTYAQLQAWQSGLAASERKPPAMARAPLRARLVPAVKTEEGRVLRSALRSSLQAYSGKPALIHTDIVRAAPLVADSAGSDLLAAHRALLDSCPVRWWVPAFNYQFPKLRALDLRSAPIEVGALNQYLHEHWADFRSFDPMFSVVGRGEAPFQPPVGEELEAFGEQSVFAHLVAQGGAVVMYGAPIGALTLVHYAESQAGGVPYRYNKMFIGQLTDDRGVAHAVRWRFHVRPYGRELDYDWNKIEALLRQQGALHPLVPGWPALGSVMDAARCVAVLVSALRDDPLTLLDPPSFAWVAPELARLGRGFALADFESEA